MKPSPGASAWAALPDGITALGFAWVWASPFAFGGIGVKTALVTMLVEFLLIHGTGFFNALSNAGDMKKSTRVLGMFGLSLFYVLMIAAFSLAFDAWWPFVAFAWLLVGKIVWTLRRPVATDDQMFSLMAAWAASVAAYLAAVMITSIPESFPRGGMAAELQPRFGLGDASGGLWVDEPHRVVAAGALYFALLCLGKLATAVWDSRRRRG
ncbi:hypothetical protein [Arenimonas sp. MALMAid1274]|uniref:hypothetical protein n=1 Tax=Arenimonas sp. MALMAid1274 TaxID=3411630 RepID=UPI003B9E7F45